MKKTGKIDRFEDLAAWQKSKKLSLLIYSVTGNSAFYKDTNLKKQMRKASVSVMSNIAEGFDRYSINEFKHFISIARGSVAEIRSQTYLAEELEYITRDESLRIIDLCVETGLILGGLRKSLERKSYPR